MILNGNESFPIKYLVKGSVYLSNVGIGKERRDIKTKEVDRSVLPLLGQLKKRLHT